MVFDNSVEKSEIDEDNPLVVAAVKQFMSRLDAGETPKLEDFLHEHREIASVLRPALEGLAMVYGAATPAKYQPDTASRDAEFTAKPIGDFQIVGELGRGGMGIVYEAIQLSLGRRVALKVLPFASGLDESRLQRFRNEAYAAAQLHHTNIVPVYAVGSDRGVQYYAMQLIDGQTLSEMMTCLRDDNSTEEHVIAAPDRDSNSPGISGGRSRASLENQRSTVLSNAGDRKRHYRSMVQLAYQATLAIEHAHEYGVVHRDIKPGNLLLDNMGKLWVTDFGLAQIEHAGSQLTRSGVALGTVRYMSPEQAAGNRAVMDHRTDIYSLGVTLYEMLTLRPAIIGHDYRTMLNYVVEQEPLAPKLVDPNLPIELDTIIRKAIAKEPTARYATAKALGDDLMAWLDDKPIAAKAPTMWQWIGKWRKRNRRLVNVAVGLMVAASVGLLITTLMVIREQQRTNLALQAERASFAQARRAVDTFSELSETELAYRPEFQNLRRRIMETSLEFYRDFISQRSSDFAESQELKEASAKVERMVEELKLLDDVAPLLMLADVRVRAELGIAPELGNELADEIEQIQVARANLGDETGPLLAAADMGIGTRLRAFVEDVGGAIDAAQMNRLRQIVRQQQLPFTFLTMEVGDALELTVDQRQQINRIIQEERPGRRGPPEGDRPRNNVSPAFGPNGPPNDRFGRAFGGGPPRRGGRDGGMEGMDRGGPPHGPEGPFSGNRGGPESEATHRTVARIVQVLTTEQKEKWDELIGAPFHFNRRPL